MSDKFDETIRLKFQIASLDEHPVFTAHSYCWGSQQDLIGIRLDEQQFLVTRNLEVALRYWRSEHEDLMIWVDAICINQDDMEEKQNQIAMVGKIYASGK